MKPIIIKGKVNSFGIIKCFKSIKKIMIKNILNIISSNVVIDIPYRKKIARKLIPESSSTKKY